MLWLSWVHPVWFFFALAAALLVMVVAVVALFNILRGLGAKLRGHFMPTRAGSKGA